MVYCNQCGKQINKDSKFCNYCGCSNEEIPTSNVDEKVDKVIINEVVNETSIINIPKPKRLIYKLIKTFVPCLIIILGGYYYYSHYISLEGKAKNAVNHYLKAIENGTSTQDFKEVGVDDYINVLDYKFLNADNPSKSDSETTTSIRIWKSLKQEFPKETIYGNSFEEYKKNIVTFYAEEGGKLISESDNEIKYTTGEKYDILSLLYDVEVTNGLGQSVYKKVNFLVENNNYDGKFKILGFDNK